MKGDNISVVCIVFNDHLGKPAVNYPPDFVKALASKMKVIELTEKHLILKRL